MRMSGLKARVGAASVAALLLGAWATAVTAGSPADPRPEAAAPGLTPFASTAELTAWIQDQQAGEPCLDPDPEVCPKEDSERDSVEEVVVTGSRASAPSITNNQQGGVDEGDVVKLRGDTLVVLRRGRLFTISIADGRMRPVDSINAYPPGVDASEDWYDEMLVSGDWVVVIGFSYDRGGTEINRFRLDAAGKLSFADSHHIGSDDYYSSRNYASRLIGDQLVFYTPTYLNDPGNPLADLPTISRWLPGQAEVVGRPLVAATDVYRSPVVIKESDTGARAIHSVVRCDLDEPELACRATAVVGPAGRSFYVTENAVYVWMSQWLPWRQAKRPVGPALSSLYRFPLNGGRPDAIRTRGAPVDQFSFLEDPQAGVLNVFLVSDAGGDAMWGPERARGGAALLRLPLSALGSGIEEADASLYRTLPDAGRSVRDRFVGSNLLYSGTHYDDAWEVRANLLNIVPLDGGAVGTLAFDTAVDRIEQMGPDALVVGGDEAMVFNTVALTGAAPVLSDRYVMPATEEAESRSHAFFYQPDPASPDGASGVLGLPVMRAFEGDNDDLFEQSADMAYLRRAGGALRPLGTLDSRPGKAEDDGCVASCIDWYGDARPIFAGGRVFALLGYELVEGRERGGRIREIGRVGFAPPPPVGPRPYWRY